MKKLRRGSHVHLGQIPSSVLLKHKCMCCYPCSGHCPEGNVHPLFFESGRAGASVLPICLSFLCTYFLYGPQFSNVINSENNKYGKIGINREKVYL